MRDPLRQQPRSWHARPGSSRPFPVRRDPIVNADIHGPGETGKRLSRAGLRPPSRILLALGAAAWLCLIAAPAVAQAPDSDPWVGLAGGHMGDIRWSVKVARPSGSAGAGHRAQRPCLQVGTKRERGRYEYERSQYQGCVDRSNRLAATESPLVVAGAQASAGLRVSLTAVGMVAAPAARRVQVTYEDGRQVTIHLQEPTPTQQQRAGLVHFRYAAFAIPGSWSVERMVTMSASGVVLWDSAGGS